MRDVALILSRIQSGGLVQEAVGEGYGVILVVARPGLPGVAIGAIPAMTPAELTKALETAARIVGDGGEGVTFHRPSAVKH